MTEVNEKERVKIDPPKKLNAKNICYWAEKQGIMLGNQTNKAVKFVMNECIKPVDKGWDVLPLKGYNVTTHEIRDGKCSCQWAKKYDKDCSHMMAVRLWQFKENWNNGK